MRVGNNRSMAEIIKAFVSSTYIDLKDHRKIVSDQLLRHKRYPEGMELFCSGYGKPWETIQSCMDDCLLCILIVGGRYGSCAEGSAISYTEQEYEYAVRSCCYIIPMVAVGAAYIPDPAEQGDPVKQEALKRFRTKIMGASTLLPWSNDTEFKENLHVALSAYSEWLRKCTPIPGYQGIAERHVRVLGHEHPRSTREEQRPAKPGRAPSSLKVRFGKFSIHVTLAIAVAMVAFVRWYSTFFDATSSWKSTTLASSASQRSIIDEAVRTELHKSAKSALSASDYSDVATLTVSHPFFDDRGATLLADPSLGLVNVRRLYLVDTGVGDEGLRAMCGPNSPLRILQILDLTRTRVTHAGIRALTQLGLPELDTLDLSHMDIGLDGFEALARHDNHLPELRTLHLHKAVVSDNGLKALGQANSGLANLAVLNLSGSNARDDGMRALTGPGITNLGQIDVRDTPVTVRGIAALRERWPGIKILSEHQDGSP